MELTFWQDVAAFFRSLRWRPTRPRRRTIMIIMMSIAIPWVFIGAVGAFVLLIAIFAEGLSPLLFLPIVAWGIVAILLVKFTNYYDDKYSHTWR